MAKIITVSNTKGGTGKSTLSIILASCLSITDKKKVLVLDCDSQNSIVNLRNLELSQSGAEPPYTIEAVAPMFVADYLKLHGDRYDYIFLDLPRITDHSKDDVIYQLITFCDYLFIPVIAGQLDALSTLSFLDGIKRIESFKKENDLFFKVRGFLNMKDRRKDNDTTIDIMVNNGLNMLNVSIPRLKLFSNASTMSSVLSTKDGQQRFGKFYQSFKKQLR